MKGLINYIIALLVVLLLWLIDLVDKSFGCESIPETQSVVTLYDGNVLTTSELRLESGQVLIHTFLSSGQEGWIRLVPENIKSVATPEGWLIIEPSLQEFSIVPYGVDDMIDLGIL